MSTCQTISKLFFGSTLISVFCIRSVLETPQDETNTHLEFLIFTLLAAAVLQLIATYLLIVQCKNVGQNVFVLLAQNQSLCISCCNFILLACFSGVTAYAIMLFFKDADHFPSTQYFGAYTLGYLLFLTLPYVFVLFYLIQICSTVADYVCGFQKHKQVIGVAGAIGLPLLSLQIASSFHSFAWESSNQFLSTIVSIATAFFLLCLLLSPLQQNLLLQEGSPGLCRIVLITMIGCFINGCFPLLSLMCALQFSSKFLEENIFAQSKSYSSQIVVQIFLLFWIGLLVPPYLNHKNTKQMVAILPDDLFSLKWLTITYMFEQFLQIETLLILSYAAMPQDIQNYSAQTSVTIVLAALANICILILCMLFTLFFFGYKDCSEAKTNRFFCCTWLFLFLVYIVFYVLEIIFLSLSDTNDFILNKPQTHLMGIAIATHIGILGYGFIYNAFRLMVHLQARINSFFSGFGNLSEAQVNELMIQLLNPNQRPELNINLEEVLERADQEKEEDQSEQDEKLCSICLGELSSNQRINEDEESREIVRIKKCKHIFHKDCISNWLHHHDFCPMDRKKVYL